MEQTTGMELDGSSLPTTGGDFYYLPKVNNIYGPYLDKLFF